MKGTLLLLGTGGSMGIPVVGCECPVCLSKDPQHHRLRSSALIGFGDKRILIDVGPDFRVQALRIGLKHLDGVLLTHPHFDHIGGLDDLRALSFISKEPIECILSRPTMDDLKSRYSYLLLPKEKRTSITAELSFRVLEPLTGEFTIAGLQFSFFSYSQSGIQVTGFRLGDLAYVSDIREYPSDIFDSLKGIKTLVLSALRKTPSPMHFSVDQAVEFAKNVNAEKTYFTHIAHELDPTSTVLPQGMSLGYDGLTCEFTIGQDG